MRASACTQDSCWPVDTCTQKLRETACTQISAFIWMHIFSHVLWIKTLKKALTTRQIGGVITLL